MMSSYAHRGLRTLVLVDNVNLHVSCKTSMGGTPDHEKLLLFARAGNPLFRAILFVVRHSEDKMDHWIETIKSKSKEWEVREKRVLKRVDGSSKADWDVDICMAAWRMIDQYDMLVIISGDGDFAGLAKRVKECGKIVRAIGVPQHTAQALIEAVDEFTPFTEDMLLESSQAVEPDTNESLGDAFRAGFDTDGKDGTQC